LSGAEKLARQEMLAKRRHGIPSKAGNSAMMTRWRLLILVACFAPNSGPMADDGTLDRAGFELGGRYWYSTGRIGYNYYGDTTTSLLVSRLTCDQ